MDWQTMTTEDISLVCETGLIINRQISNFRD